MLENAKFNITNTDVPTNKDLVVVFSPSSNAQYYTYTIYKDNNILETKTINGKESSEISLTQTGSYKIVVVETDNQTQQQTISSGLYIIDKESPVIYVNKNEVELHKGDQIPGDIISITDNYTTNFENSITSNIDNINLTTTGRKVLTYTVSDEAGNTATQDINIYVAENPYTLFIVQTIVILSAFIAIYLIARFARSLKIAKRIEPFVIEPLKTKEPSLIDRIVTLYQLMLEKWQPYLKKSVIVQKYSKKLDKYRDISLIHRNGTEIFISKLIFSLLFILVAIFTKAVQFKLLEPYEFFLPFIIGFFLLDIVYFIKYKAYKNKLENDLLSAIIIMNNAFKSGRSIVQAIDIVSKEMDGQIAREFSRMSVELSYGLEIDAVFKRFAQRINLEEVNYLTASLTILNRTGGNIVEVFSSIEKTMFNKKKLRLELASLTTGSRIIVYVLFVVPFLFILFVSLISPSYFEPFITTDLGRILTVFMVIYYIIFIVTVRKIMKVVI